MSFTKEEYASAGNICVIADELKVIIENNADFEWAEKYRQMVVKKCRLFLQPEWSRFDVTLT